MKTFAHKCQDWKSKTNTSIGSEVREITDKLGKLGASAYVKKMV